MDYELQERIKELVSLLNRANRAYYLSGKPIMTDADYDTLEKMYEKLAGEKYDKSRFIKESQQTKRMVDTEHTFKNLLTTIDNKFQTLNELFEWLDHLSINSNEELDILITEKYDGNSLCIEYDAEGNAVVAVTRGADGKGKNLIDIFKDDKIENIFNEYIGIRYEVMLSYESFDKLNLLKIEENESLYANPRNTVAGLLARLDAYKFRDFLTLVPLSVRVQNQSLTREEELEFLSSISKEDVPLVGELITGTINELKNYLTNFYQEYAEKREKLNYMIDGLVLEFTDSDIKNYLGSFTNGSPKWQAAVKFPCMQRESVVTGMVFEASPNGTGRITPSVLFKPVIFNGAKMEKVSLSNYKRFQELKLGVGSKIMVELRNDVLAYVTKLEDDKEIEPIPFATECPICKGKVQTTVNDKNEETFIYCTNPNCKMKIIGKINNYLDMVRIKGIEIATLTKIFDAGLISKFEDIYNLKFITLSKVVGEQTARNIVDAIMENQPYDYEILAGLGIPNCGKETAKTILQEYKLEELNDRKLINSSEFKTKLSTLNNIGEKMTEYIISGLNENAMSLFAIMTNVIPKSSNYKKVENMLTFVTTGDPDPEYFTNRSELQKFIEEKGHKLTNSVSKNTNYLVTENTGSGTVKNKKAKELKVPIITCKELVEKILK